MQMLGRTGCMLADQTGSLLTQADDGSASPPRIAGKLQPIEVSPEVHQNEVQRAAESKLPAFQRLTLECHQQRHASEGAALILHRDRGQAATFVSRVLPQ